MHHDRRFRTPQQWSATLPKAGLSRRYSLECDKAAIGIHNWEDKHGPHTHETVAYSTTSFRVALGQWLCTH